MLNGSSNMGGGANDWIVPNIPGTHQPPYIFALMLPMRKR